MNRVRFVDNLCALHILLLPRVLSLDKANEVQWEFKNLKKFSVGASYSALGVNTVSSTLVLLVFDSRVFNLLWATSIPMKIKVFGWRVMLYRLANKDQLFRRGILSSSHDLPCALCLCEDESLLHLFVNCGVSKQVWDVIFKWIKIDVMVEEGIVDYFSGVSSVFVKKVSNNRVGVIWWAALWGIWIHIN